MPFRLRESPVTAVLLFAIAVLFLLETWAGGSTNQQVLYALGANEPHSVLQQGQWWRLFASMFLHIGFAHVLLNGWALYQLGSLYELAVGSFRMLMVYLASGLAGSVASVLWRDEGLSAGASGAIFGLLGAMIAFLLRRRDRLTPYAKSLLGQLVVWAGINVFFGFSIGAIDNAAHLGGCAAGFLMGLLLRGREPERRPVEAPV
ncbi:MAG TPA: rhomboid family intramembrane serine protease [Thermoanaerobaculia bacterium]|nr:rhomboid family intramembrane serine protease [Thermoanaerobaculia bacterium]